MFIGRLHESDCQDIYITVDLFVPWIWTSPMLRSNRLRLGLDAFNLIFSYKKLLPISYLRLTSTKMTFIFFTCTNMTFQILNWLLLAKNLFDKNDQPGIGKKELRNFIKISASNLFIYLFIFCPVLIIQKISVQKWLKAEYSFKFHFSEKSFFYSKVTRN